jgi:hypothetical protein
MNMKKTKKTFRLGALLLIVCLISTVMLSGTFAKYTSEYAGQDTALVARWSFMAKGGDSDTNLGAVASNTELKLFDHLYDTHINQTDGVAEPNTKFILAPGVSDEFTLKMDYIADVDADVKITIDKLGGSADVPIEYSADNGATWVTLADLPDELAKNIVAKTPNATTVTGSSDTSGKLTDTNLSDKTFRIAAVANNIITPVSISQKVMWRWTYEPSEEYKTGEQNDVNWTDADDTDLGVASQTAAQDTVANRTTYGIKITLNATQVVPETPIEIESIGAITGTFQVGQTLTAGGLTPDGAIATYQWQISDSVDGIYSNIAGATSNTYTPVADNATKFIKVVATGTNGYSGTVTSVPVGPIAAATP